MSIADAGGKHMGATLELPEETGGKTSMAPASKTRQTATGVTSETPSERSASRKSLLRRFLPEIIVAAGPVLAGVGFALSGGFAGRVLLTAALPVLVIGAIVGAVCR